MSTLDLEAKVITGDNSTSPDEVEWLKTQIEEAVRKLGVEIVIWRLWYEGVDDRPTQNDHRGSTCTMSG